MDTISETKEPYVDEGKLARITECLTGIDPVLIPFAKLLARLPYKDLSDPEAFSQRCTHLEPTDLVAVHLTNTFPKDGIIYPAAHYDPDLLRFSLHLTINSVSEDAVFNGMTIASWKNTKYAVLIPLDKIKDRIEEFNVGDTLILDELELPEGTVVIKDQSDLVAAGAGKAQIVEADYSREGERLSGIQMTTYEQIIKMGYFPQSSANEMWIGWGMYRNIFQDFCQDNGLNMGAGHRHHWSWRLEEFSEYFKKVVDEKDETKFKDAITEAREYYLEGKNWWAPFIPEKYKQALVDLLQRYSKDLDKLTQI